MIRLKRLYLEPNIASGKPFRELVFQPGINIIVGEKSSDDHTKNEQEKMNSVGKSLSMELVNYCLFKDPSSSRVERVPEDNLQQNTYVCLDFEYESNKVINQLTIKRSKNTNNPIIIIEDGNETGFKTLEEVKKYTEKYFFPGAENHPSLRQLVSILIRNEKHGFDDILYPEYKSSSFEYSSIITPHAYLFGFDVNAISQIRKLRKQIETAGAVITELNRVFATKEIKIADVKSYINDLEDRVRKLDIAIKDLKPAEGMSQIKDELKVLYENLDSLVSKKTANTELARKIKSLPKPDQPDVDEVKRVYDNFRDGLGDIVKASFENVLEFREQMHGFQEELMSKKLDEVNEKIAELDKQIAEIDQQIGEYNKRLGVNEKVTDLRESLLKQQQDSEQLEQLRSTYRQLEDSTRRKDSLLKTRTKYIDDLRIQLVELEAIVNQFETDLKSIHSFIANNQFCHFKISVSDRPNAVKFTNFMSFDYRTDLDGGSGVDRIKTFIYDVLLMTSPATAPRHPKFLIHDNIFASAGLEDTIRSLNYLHSLYEKGQDFQYIFTINRDEYESKLKDLSFKASDRTVIELTREQPLLNSKYIEM
jgi:uncharacterized protein YydD (DUF2326 family)